MPRQGHAMLTLAQPYTPTPVDHPVQWPCSHPLIREIPAPVAMLAVRWVGYE
jgi:hypothetical protein